MIRVICYASYARCSMIKAYLIRPHITSTLHARKIEQNGALSVVYDCALLRPEAALLWVLSTYPVRLPCITRPRKRREASLVTLLSDGTPHQTGALAEIEPNFDPGSSGPSQMDRYHLHSHFTAANAEHAPHPLHEQKCSNSLNSPETPAPQCSVFGPLVFTLCESQAITMGPRT